MGFIFIVEGYQRKTITRVEKLSGLPWYTKVSDGMPQ